MKDMEEEQSFFHLIEYLESYLLELGLELQRDPDDLFLQGKLCFGSLLKNCIIRTNVLY